METVAILVRGGGEAGPEWVVYAVIGVLLVVPAVLGLAMRWWDRR